MNQYKCPYCGQFAYKATNLRFSNWKSVRKHTSTCTKNTKEYMICEYYGPISINVYNNYSSIESFKKDYPNCTFNKVQWRTLRVNNKSNLVRNKWTKLTIIEAIKKFHQLNSRIPGTRDFELDSMYPSVGTVITYFNSWNKAIEESGFIANKKTIFGIPTYAKDGILYRSKVEAYFVDHFLFEKEEYEYEKPYGNGWLFDFYLPKYNLYIEIDGEYSDDVRNYRTRITDKLLYCKENNINLIKFNYTDVYKKDFNFKF
jgi:hypothetical protein